MRRKRGLLSAVLLISSVSAAATDWDQLHPAENFSHAPIVQALISTDDQGWWVLAGSGDPHRPRTLARYEYTSSFPVAHKYLQPDFRVTAISAAPNDGVYVVDGSSPGCFGTCTAFYSTLQRRDATGELIWQRTLRGLCGAPIAAADSADPAGSTAVLCSGRVYRLAANGATLSESQPLDLLGDNRQPDQKLELLADGGSLIVGGNTAAVVDPNGAMRWQRVYDPPVDASWAVGSSIYLQFGRESARFSVVSAADGSDVAQAQIPGTVRAGVGWQQQLWLAVTVDAQEYLVALNAVAEIVDNLSLPAGSSVLAMAVSLGDRATATLLAGLDAGNGTLALLRLQANGNLGIRTVSNAAAPLRLLGAPLGGALVVSVLPGSAQRSLGISALGSAGVPLAPVVRSIRTPFTGVGVIDGQASELWLSELLNPSTAPSANAVLAMSRIDFSVERSWVTYAPGVPSFSQPGVVSRPVLTEAQSCALHSPNPATPEREDVSHLVCVQRRDVAEIQQTEVRMPGPDSRLIGLGADAAGNSVILGRSLNAVLSPTWRAVVDPFGGVDYQSPSVSFLPPVVLEPDLSGLLGNSLIDESAQVVAAVGGIELASQPLTGIWLSDGELILLSQDLRVTPASVDALTSGRIEKVSPTGQLRWSVPLPFSAATSVDNLRLAASDAVLSLEVGEDLGREATRLIFDLQTGSTLRQGLPARLTAGTHAVVNLAETDATQRMWRVAGLSKGLLAEPIWPPADARVWLPCGFDQCVVRAVGADPSGRALIQLEGRQDREFRTNLGTADLNLLLKLPAPVGPPADGIWRRDDDANQGLVVGQRPRDRQQQTMLVELTRASDFESAAVARWWKLQPVFADTGARDYDLGAPPAADFPRPTGQRGSATPRRAALYPLVDSGWLLSIAETFPAPFPLQFRELYSDRLRSADGAKVYFADDNHWLALDLIQGTGVWGRPNGRWLSVQRIPNGEWQFSDPSQPAAADGPTLNTQPLGVASLVVSTCKSLRWRVEQVNPESSAQFARDFRGTVFAAGSCR